MEIKRPQYLSKIIETKNDGLVKIVTGIRRCGKSYLLFNIYARYLQEELHIKKNDIITFAFDNDEDIDLLDKYYKEEPTKIYLDKEKRKYVINSKKFREYVIVN